jgi:hypothetical protein
VGLIAIGLLSFYFWYGHKQFREISDPQTLVNYGVGLLNDHMPEVRASTAAQIRASAPQWAEELSNELVKRMPDGRVEIENQIKTYIDTQFLEAKTITQDTFKKMIADNRAEIDEAVKTILDGKESGAFVDAFLPVMEKSVGVDLQNNAAEALGSFVDLNERLERLAKGENLTDLEKQQRYVLGLVQRLRLEQTELK